MSKQKHEKVSNEPSNTTSIAVYIIIVVIILFGGVILFGGNSSKQEISKSGSYTEADLAPVVDGVQKAAITVNTSSYSPGVTVLKAGVPAEITFMGQGYGCSTAVVSRDFWDGAVYVNKGDQKIVTFTPEKTGTYKYACTMGMYTGYFEII
jgi:plastocyanin domain-containing protein